MYLEDDDIEKGCIADDRKTAAEPPNTVDAWEMRDLGR